MVMWEGVSGLERKSSGALVTELKESMDRCIGHHDVNEITLKTIQSINQFLGDQTSERHTIIPTSRLFDHAETL